MISKISNFTEQMTEVYTYWTSPMVYCLLYDLHYRTEVYNIIQSEKKSDYGKFFKFNKVVTDSDIINFEENFILDYYRKLSRYELLGLAYIGFSSLFILFLSKTNEAHYQQNKFIFLDNSRLLSNHMLTFRFLYKRIALAVFFTTSLIGCAYVFGFTIYKNVMFLKEEKEILIKYKKELEKYHILFKYKS